MESFWPSAFGGWEFTGPFAWVWKVGSPSRKRCLAAPNLVQDMHGLAQWILEVTFENVVTRLSQTSECDLQKYTMAGVSERACTSRYNESDLVESCFVLPRKEVTDSQGASRKQGHGALERASFLMQTTFGRPLHYGCVHLLLHRFAGGNGGSCCSSWPLV